MARDGARLGHSLHLPSPVNHRQLCKRAILAWEQRHGQRLSTCRRWLRRNRPLLHLHGGGLVDNIQGLLIRYTLINVNDSEVKQQVQKRVQKREIWNGKKWVDMTKMEEHWSTSLLGGDQSASSTTGNENTKTVTVLWVRHCFGCHNYKFKEDKLTFIGQFMYRVFNQTSLCTTDGEHMKVLVDRAQTLKTQVESAHSKNKNVTYKYYSSILPRAMMTAKLVQRVIKNNATAENLLAGVERKYLKDLQCIEGAAKPPPQQETAEAEPQQGDAIQRMWYVSEQFNRLEKLDKQKPLFTPTIRTLLAVLCVPLILSTTLLCCASDGPALINLVTRRIRSWWGAHGVTFTEGLNRLNKVDSDKYVKYLNTMFGNTTSFSTDDPMGRASVDRAPVDRATIVTPSKGDDSYDEPNLMTWEKEVLPQLVNHSDQQIVHLIVSHGKTMARYMNELVKTNKRNGKTQMKN